MSDYVTADFHFDHGNILKFERGSFHSIEAHNEAIIRGMNRVLRPGDTLYVLGDVGFRTNGSLDSLARLMRRIECDKKILVMGNHDHFSEIEARTVLGFSEVHKGPIYYPSKIAPGRIILSHEPVKEAYGNPYVINVHGHIHANEIHADGFYNVNVAKTSYTPQNLRHFEDIASKLKSRNETFGEEWYYDLYDRKGAKK